LKELTEALRPVWDPKGVDNHVSPATPTAAIHATLTRLNSREDERSSPLAKMTRIFDGQKDDVDGKAFSKGFKRKTL